MKLYTIKHNNFGVGVIVTQFSASANQNVHHAFIFDNNGGLFGIGEHSDFEKAQSLILNQRELFDSSGNVVKNRPFISCADIAKGFKIIHADGKAVGFAMAEAYMQRNINENAIWEVYKYTNCGPKHLGKAETKVQIINRIGSEDELVDGSGERI